LLKFLHPTGLSGLCRSLPVILAISLLLNACGSAAQTAAPAASTQAASTSPATSPGASPATSAAQAESNPDTLLVMTHDAFAMSEDVLAKFEKDNHVKVQFVKSGDAGTALNKAILSKDKPLADVFYGLDNTFLSRALDEGIFEPYESPNLANISQEFRLDPQNRALPIDYGDVCLNYDKGYFTQHNLTPPQSLDDLAKPDYKGLLVVENPATSSPGLAFLLTTIGAYGENGYLDYWKRLKANDVEVVNDWETAYNAEFSGSSGKGPRPIVVSYSSSPVFEVIYAETPKAEPPTAAVVSDNTCFRQVEFAGLLKGARNPELAKKWIDFMLSPDFQSDMPMQMFVFPVNPAAALDPAFVKFMANPQKPANVSPQDIAQKRETWLKAWNEAVLR
jgi:thiamine transport system substrate-binding protein